MFVCGSIGAAPLAHNGPLEVIGGSFMIARLSNFDASTKFAKPLVTL
jgi:hypothetical protein